jgi:hypothetical protein
MWANSMELYFYSPANFEAPASAFPFLQLSLCVPKSFMVERMQSPLMLLTTIFPKTKA